MPDDETGTQISRRNFLKLGFSLNVYLLISCDNSSGNAENTVITPDTTPPPVGPVRLDITIDNTFITTDSTKLVVA